MAHAFSRAVIVGATGPAGRALARTLAEDRVPVRAVSRSAAHLAAVFGPEADVRAADARDPAALRSALDGCDVVFDCVGMVPGGTDAFVAHARGLAAALRDTRARAVQVSSYWAYAPLTTGTLDETHPRTGGPAPVRARRAAEDALRDAGAVIAHLPDFFGPHVHTSTLQNPLRDAVAGRTTNWIGGLDVPREYAYLPDAVRAVVALAGSGAAAGARFVVPGSGPITPREVCAIASRHLGREVRARGAGRWLLRVLALFSKDLRAFAPLLPTYLRPLRFDASALRAQIGATPATPYDVAIPATLDAVDAGLR